MRDITASSLVFWLCLGPSCVPTVPRARQLPPPAPGAADPPATAAPAPEPPASGAPSRGSGAGGGTGVDAGVTVDAAHGPAGSDAARAETADAVAAPEPPTARAPRPGELVIDELLVDPAGNDLGHEWLEIANLAGEPIDLGALRVTDGASEAAVAAGVLPAGGLLVLGQSADRAHNGDAPVDLAYGTRLSLNNGADRLALCLGPCAAGVTLDAVAWTAPWGDAYVGHAVVVERGGATCPAEEPYGTGGNFGSPGRPNPPCPTTRAEPGRDGGASDGDARDGSDAR